MRGLAEGASFSIMAAVLAVALFRQTGGDGSRSPTEAAAPKEEPRAERPPTPAETEDDVPDACRDGERLLTDFRELYGEYQRFRPLIVLAPDPLESGSTDLLDLVIEGIEEAVSEDMGDGRAYVHDHRWLPWTDGAAAAAGCWEKSPGVIVYRPLDGPGLQDPLMVLVVGETPIWGLRPGQFEAAIELIRVHGVAGAGLADPIPVLGPTYSGTAASLSAVISAAVDDRKLRRPFIGWLGAAHDRPLRFDIVSASATTVKAGEILVPSSSTAPPGSAEADPCVTPARVSRNVTYESVTATDACFLGKMEEFLLARGGRCDDDGGGNIVLFTETSTTYGSAGVATGKCFLRWKLPPDLASLRKTAEKASDKGKRVSGLADVPAEHAGTGEWTGKKLSAGSIAAHALALDSTLDRLSNSKIRFAGILASDPRDVLFLARRFRRQLPDIRFFTLGASIQYVDERAADAVNGMLVVDSPPGDGNRSMSLQNEFVRKVYHAGRRLLVDAPVEREVQVSFIGNGRLWRIDDFPRHPNRDRPYARRARGPSVPISWQFTFAVFVVILAGMAIVVGLATRKDCSRPRGRFWALVAPCSFDDLRRHDYALSAGLVLTCAGPVLLMLESMMARNWQEPDHASACIAMSALVVLTTWIIYFVGQRAHRTPDHWCLSIVPITASTIVLVLALYAGCGPERRATFHLLSGGSPVLVGLIAMMSYGLAFWCARTRLRMLDTHRFHAEVGRQFAHIKPPIAQALGETLHTRRGLAAVEGRVLKALYHPWKDGWFVPIVLHAILVVTIAVPMWIKAPHTLEPGWRNHALIGLAIVAALPASVNLAWFVTTWLRFMRLLRRLATYPAIAALARLPDRRVRPLEEQLAWSGSEGTELIYPVEVLGRLAAIDPTVRGTHERCRALLEDRLSAEATRKAECSADLADLLLATSAEATSRRATKGEETRKRIDEFAASLIDLFIPRYVRHFRLFAPPMVLGCLCSIFLASLYFVQPQRLVATVALFWVAVTASVVLVSYVSLYLDPVLTAVSGAAGKITSRFALVRKVVVWAAVPVASYFAVDHPEFPLWVSNVLEFAGKSLR